MANVDSQQGDQLKVIGVLISPFATVQSSCLSTLRHMHVQVTMLPTAEVTPSFVPNTLHMIVATPLYVFVAMTNRFPACTITSVLHCLLVPKISDVDMSPARRQQGKMGERIRY